MNLISDVDQPGEYAITARTINTAGVVAGNTNFAVNAAFNGSGVQTSLLENGRNDQLGSPQKN